MKGRTHYLTAIHAFREGDELGCGAQGSKRVSLKIDEVTCRACSNFFWHEGLVLSPQGERTLQELSK